MNADGAVFSKQKWAGIGVIARDDQGRVVAAMSKRLKVRWVLLRLRQRHSKPLLVLQKILVSKR